MKKYLIIGGWVLLSLSLRAQELAKPFAIKLTGDKLAIRVLSNGCTTAKSFTLDWQNSEMTIYRNAPDNCRRMPHLIWINLSVDTNQYPFSIKNPIAMMKNQLKHH